MINVNDIIFNVKIKIQKSKLRYQYFLQENLDGFYNFNLSFCILRFKI